MYKSIDFQTSLPRSLEMSQLAQQQQQKPVHEQATLGQQQMKAAEQQAHRTPKTEAASGGTIKERDPRERGNRQEAGKRNKTDGQNDTEGKPVDHPYKGKHIDFTG